jgi:hypothetical protein
VSDTPITLLTPQVTECLWNLDSEKILCREAQTLNRILAAEAAQDPVSPQELRRSVAIADTQINDELIRVSYLLVERKRVCFTFKTNF